MENNELAHWGIKGMKWGVRRYQNKDGSLTAAGKRREESEDHKAAALLKKKKKYEMSNAELKKLNERLRLEQEYSQLTKKNISRGQKLVVDVLNEVGKDMLKKTISKYATKGLEQTIGSIGKNKGSD